MQKIYDVLSKKSSGKANRFEIYSALTEVLQKGLEHLGTEKKSGVFDFICLADKLLMRIDSCVTEVYDTMSSQLIDLEDEDKFEEFDRCYTKMVGLVEMAIQADIKVTSESSQA